MNYYRIDNPIKSYAHPNDEFNNCYLSIEDKINNSRTGVMILN
jgi:hypothetical protein